MIRNKILYLLLASYSVVFAILYNAYVTATIMVLILCLPVFLLVILFGTTPFIKVKVYRSEKLVTRGEDITISVQVKNTSIFPITYCRLYFVSYGEGKKEQVKEQIRIAMDAKSEQIIRCQIKANHCGIMTFSCDTVRNYDYFRIFSLRKPCKKQIKIMVLPKLYEIEEEFIPNPCGIVMDSDVFSKKKSGDDPSEVFGIREYQEGDRLHRIHWKLSSKKDQLMIKEFSLPVNCSVDILVDLYVKNGKDMGVVDAIYETLASVSNHLSLCGILHSVTWYDTENQECIRVHVEEWDHIYDALEALFRSISYQEKDKFLQVYRDEFGRFPMADTFYIGQGTPEFVETYLVPTKETRLHVLCLGKQETVKDRMDTNISFIELENLEASLKRMVF